MDSANKTIADSYWDNPDRFMLHDLTERNSLMRRENTFECLNELNQFVPKEEESIRYNLVLQKDACEVQLSSKNQRQDFCWKFFTKQKTESWYEKAPKANKELFRGNLLETHFHKNNQLAYQCKPGQNLKEALKLLRELQHASPAPVHTVIMETEIFPYWGAINFTEKLVTEIRKCDNLCIYGKIDKQVLAILLDRIKVSKYLLVNNIHKVHLDHEKFSKLPYFNVQTSDDVPLSQLLACAGNDGSFILPSFNIAKANSLLKYWLSSRIDTVKTLTIVVNERKTRNFEKIIDGLEQYGAKEGKKLGTKSIPEKIEIIRCLGFEVHRSDGAIGTVLLSRDRRTRIPFYNFVLHVRYPDEPWPRCKFAVARDYFQERDKDKALAVKWKEMQELKVQSDTSALGQQRFRLYNDEQKVLNSQRARVQLRIQHFKHAWQIHSHAEKRQEYGFFGLLI